jgi:hypothetical protein
VILNPVSLRPCHAPPKPWRADLRYHLRNRNYLASMALADQLGPTNIWARQAVFFVLSMGLFVIAAHLEEVKAWTTPECPVLV